MSNPGWRETAVAGVVLAGLWQVLALVLERPLVPGLGAIAVALAKGLRGPLLGHAGASLARVLGAIVVSLALGCPLGIWLGQSRLANRLLAPVVYLFYPVPKIVFVPLILLWFGVGNLPKVLLICLVLVNQMIVLVRDSVATMPPELVGSVRSLGAGRAALWRFVYLPASLPAVLSSLRQSIGTAFAVLYIAEQVATSHGLGYAISHSGSVLFDYPAMYAGILVMAGLGLGLFLAVDWLQRRLCPHLASG